MKSSCPLGSKPALILGLVLMGFSFTITQALMIREFLVSFNGNELSIGLIIGAWLLIEAASSGTLGRLSEKWDVTPITYAVLQVIAAFALPFTLYLVYNSRLLAGAHPGEGVSLGSIFTVSLIVLLGVAAVDGAMFSLGARSYARLTGEEASSIGWVYGLETIGAALGGILFTFALIPHFFSVQIILSLTILNLISALAIVVTARRTRKSSSAEWILYTILPLLTGVSLFLLVRNAADFQHRGNANRWPGFTLVFSKSSIYGEISVVRLAEQHTFFVDGLPIFTSPLPEVTLAEEFVHLPMLFAPYEDSALVLSGGLGGVLYELEKYPFQEIDYAEIDPLLIQVARKYPSPLTEQELGDPRLRVEAIDGRLLVHRKIREADPGEERGYDFILINLPSPTTLQLNRFYTLEFFQMIHDLLSDDGILVLSTHGTLTYISDELRALNSSIYLTLLEVFRSVRPIPGEITLWLASKSQDLNQTNIESLVARWDQHDVSAKLITPPHIRLKLDEDRKNWFIDELNKESRSGMTARVNSDLHPIGLSYAIAYWNSQFSPRMAEILQPLHRMSFWVLFIPLLMVGVTIFVAIRSRNIRTGVIMPVVVASTGFAGMSADLMVILAFQSLYGYVYQWVGLIIAAFMTGLGLSAMWMTKRLGAAEHEARTLLITEISQVALWIVIPAGLALYSGRPPSAAFAEALRWLLLLVNGTAGFLVGAQFPVANCIWMKDREGIRRKMGALYAYDLIGATLAAMLTAIVLIPILGLIETCLLVAVIKGISFLLSAQSVLNA